VKVVRWAFMQETGEARWWRLPPRGNEGGNSPWPTLIAARQRAARCCTMRLLAICRFAPAVLTKMPPPALRAVCDAQAVDAGRVAPEAARDRIRPTVVPSVGRSTAAWCWSEAGKAESGQNGWRRGSPRPSPTPWSCSFQRPHQARAPATARPVALGWHPSPLLALQRQPVDLRLVAVAVS